MSALLSLFAVVAVAWWYAAKRPDVSRLLLLSLAAYVFLWAVVPLAYVALRPEHTGYPLGDPDYLRIAQLHLLSLGVTLTLFAALPNRRWRRVTYWGRFELHPRTTYLSLVVAAAALVVVEMWTLSITGWGFIASIQFAVRANASELGRKALLDTVLIFLVGFAIVCAIRDWAGTRYGARILATSWAMLLAYAAISIMQGARAAVLLPLFVFISRRWIVDRHLGLVRHWRTIAFLLVACLTMGPVLLVVGLTRDVGDTRMTTFLMSRAFEQTFASRAIRDQLLLVADGFYVKFEHFRTGVTLLSREGEERATWTPIVSAAYSPIPRVILPGKPVPLSRDGQVTGMPWRIAASSIGDVMTGAVVPVAPAAVSLWEFGWLGVVLLILANVYHLVLLNTLLTCRSLAHQALGISLLSLPTTEFLFSGPAYLLRDDLRVMLYLLLINVVVRAWISRAPAPGAVPLTAAA